MGTNNPLVTKSSGIKPRPQGGGGKKERKQKRMATAISLLPCTIPPMKVKFKRVTTEYYITVFMEIRQKYTFKGKIF